MARAARHIEQAEEALFLVGRMLRATRAMKRQGDEIRYLALCALAFQAQKDQPSARIVLTQALKLAQPEGHVWHYVDEGEPMALLLTH